MTAQELAALLHGREYMHEITKAEEAAAKAAGLVVMFGASDDLVEIRGAIDEEIGAYDGTTLRMTPAGILPKWDDMEMATEEEAEAYFEKKRLGSREIKAVFSPADLPDTTWVFKTDIPHATFDVMEDGVVFCRGIVFALGGVLEGFDRTAAAQAAA